MSRNIIIVILTAIYVLAGVRVAGVAERHYLACGNSEFTATAVASAIGTVWPVALFSLGTGHAFFDRPQAWCRSKK